MSAVTGPTFVVSLDFELYWGVRDVYPLARYRENLLGVRRAIPAMLELFARYGVRATWATVGFLFCEGRDELLANLPAVLPLYANDALDPYRALGHVGRNEREDPFHFAPSLIAQIARTPGQEIATHTHSHFYCLERGQSAASFRADLQAAVTLARRKGFELRSIVFPRNQHNPAYDAICREQGVLAIRGNPDVWMHRARNWEQESRLRKLARLVDHYVPLVSGAPGAGVGAGAAARDVAMPAEGGGAGVVDVPASRFLRPYSPRTRRLDALRLHRMRREFQDAARSGALYHLWWHPHNFGVNLRENLRMLQAMLEQFAALRARFAVRSLTMQEYAREAIGAGGPQEVSVVSVAG